MKKRFEAAPHVGTVNGRAVPANRIVELSEIEAAYFVSIGKIAPAPEKKARRGRSK